jgi:hypothetical protein
MGEEFFNNLDNNFDFDYDFSNLDNSDSNGSSLHACGNGAVLGNKV